MLHVLQIGKRLRGCECVKCTGVIDLRAQPVELSEGMLRQEPGLISIGNRKMLLAALNAVHTKYVELWDAGVQFYSGDQLHEDLKPCLALRAHLELSLGMARGTALLPHDESALDVNLWHDDLKQVILLARSYAHALRSRCPPLTPPALVSRRR